MAYDLKGDLGEEVTDDPLFSRSPTADPRDGPARRGLLAPDRSSLPGQPLLRHPAVATLPPHRLPPTQTPWRRKPRQTRAGGLGAAPGVGPTATRCHARGIAPAARRRLQHHGHLSRPEASWGCRARRRSRAPRSRTARRSRSNGGNSARNWPAWTRTGWSSWTNAGPTRR